MRACVRAYTAAHRSTAPHRAPPHRRTTAPLHAPTLPRSPPGPGGMATRPAPPRQPSSPRPFPSSPRPSLRFLPPCPPSREHWPSRRPPRSLLSHHPGPPSPDRQPFLPSSPGRLPRRPRPHLRGLHDLLHGWPPGWPRLVFSAITAEDIRRAAPSRAEPRRSPGALGPPTPSTPARGQSTLVAAAPHPRQPSRAPPSPCQASVPLRRWATHKTSGGPAGSHAGGPGQGRTIIKWYGLARPRADRRRSACNAAPSPRLPCECILYQARRTCIEAGPGPGGAGGRSCIWV